MTPKSSPPCWWQISVRQELATKEIPTSDSKYNSVVEKVAAHELLMSKHYTVTFNIEHGQILNNVHHNLHCYLLGNKHLVDSSAGTTVGMPR